MPIPLDHFPQFSYKNVSKVYSTCRATVFPVWQNKNIFQTCKQHKITDRSYSQITQSLFEHFPIMWKFWWITLYVFFYNPGKCGECVSVCVFSDQGQVKLISCSKIASVFWDIFIKQPQDDVFWIFECLNRYTIYIFGDPKH